MVSFEFRIFVLVQNKKAKPVHQEQWVARQIVPVHIKIFVPVRREQRVQNFLYRFKTKYLNRYKNLQKLKSRRVRFVLKRIITPHLSATKSHKLSLSKRNPSISKETIHQSARKFSHSIFLKEDLSG